jgi:RHS repeat-associated protein
MRKHLKYISLWSLFACTQVHAQNVPTGGTTPAATQSIRTAPAAYTGVPSNYLRTFVPQVPIQDTSLINMSSAVEDVQTGIVYADSYGRTIESVTKQLSPAKKDNVSAPYYDEFGRSGSFSYPPFVAVSGNTNDGAFKANPFQQDSVFYKSLYPAEQVIYGQTIYDGSPINMPIKAMAAGNENGGADRGKTFAHRSSTAADSVRFWTIAISTEDDIPATTAYYVPGTLNVQEITDEHGIKSITYTDLTGKTILTKAQLAGTPATGPTGWLCTYYIYDETGRLRTMIPPKAVEQLTADSWVLTTDNRDGLCYRYWYDSRGRQIMKYVPGKGKSYTAYDLLDRPVMAQNPKLRLTNQWAFVLYDAQSRPVKSGVITNDNTAATIQATAATSSSYPALSGTYTVYSESYYDNYDWVSTIGAPVSSTISNSNVNSTNFITSYNTSPAYAQPIDMSYNIRGASTGSKTLVLGTSTYLYSSIFYDSYGRSVQTQQSNYSSGIDVSTVQYSYGGTVLRRHLAHSKAATNAQTHTMLTKYTYDHAHRLLSLTKSADGLTDKLLSQLTYAETGQVQQKVFGSSLETQQYSYNISEQLIGINSGYVTTPNATTAYFGESLSYEHGFTNNQYNGGIAGVQWKTGGDNIQRAYGYTYDNAGRLTKADFVQQNTGSTAWTTDKADYTVSGLAYDAGGNILRMSQKGLLTGSSATIDSLAYTYFANSNRLQKIGDAATAGGGLGDFKDSSNAGYDYAYDANGNIILDNNRHLHTASGSAGAVFNLLDKPDSMTVAGKSTTYYTYDAGGNMLQRRVKDFVNNTTNTYTYISSYVYLNDTLQYTATEEGRMRLLAGGSAAYDYYIKDHAGNIRAMLTDEQRTDQYPAATMETANLTMEQQFYANLDTRVLRSSVTDFPSDPPPDNFEVPTANDYAAQLSGAAGARKTGPSIVLKVMAGDQFNIKVHSWYRTNSVTPGTPSPLGDIATAMINAVSGTAVLNTHGVTNTELTNAGSFNPTNFLNTQDSSTATSKPKAFLNWILFDEQFNYVSSSSGFEQVPDESAFGTGANAHTYLHVKSNMPVSKSGYLYIYTSNETPNINVYFDNLQVSHKRGALLETNEYYPFGLPMKNISYKAAGTIQNRNKSNGGNMYEDEGDLNYSNTFFRKYDAQVGRFTGIDMMAESFAGINPYQFAVNNPVLFSDPTGALSQMDGGGNYHHSWTNILGDVGPWANGGQGFGDFFNTNEGGSNGTGGGNGSATTVPGGYVLTGASAQQAFSALQNAYNNPNEDGEWSFTLENNKNGELGYWAPFSLNNGDDLNLAGVGTRWTAVSQGPGTFYGSADAAAFAIYKRNWAFLKGQAMSSSGSEWSSLIYSVVGKGGKLFYSYTPLITSRSRNSNPGPDDKRHILPRNATIAAYFHSHVYIGGLTSSNEFFSKGSSRIFDYDQPVWSKGNIDWYLFSMNGNLRVARTDENKMDILLASINKQNQMDVNPYSNNFRIDGQGLTNGTQLNPIPYIP